MEYRNNKSAPSRPAPKDHTWTYTKEIGAGAGGKAHLWTLVDLNQVPVERMVIKNMDVENYLFLEEDPSGGKLKEPWIQQQLAPVGTPPGQTFTVPIYSFQPIPGTQGKGYSIYCPYYAFGDLGHFIENQQKPLPEPYLWLLFHRLASAVVVMDENMRSEEQDDLVVVHCDIKPDNVFLDSPGSLGNNTPFVAYPLPYLGDFGLAEVLTRDDPDADGCIGQGTDVWMPPEIDDAGDELILPVPAYSYTNVWQIGYLVLRMMELIVEPERIDWHSYESYEPSLTRQADYSQDLIRLVRSCVRFHSEDRPTPRALLEAINSVMPKHTEGMDRWGTFDWFERQESNVSEPPRLGRIVQGDRKRKHHEEEEHQGEEKKAKISTGDQTRPGSFGRIRQRRLRLVAQQIRDGVTDGLAYVTADSAFILEDRLKMIHHTVDNIFDIEKFFSKQDPKPASPVLETKAGSEAPFQLLTPARTPASSNTVGLITPQSGRRSGAANIVAHMVGTTPLPTYSFGTPPAMWSPGFTPPPSGLVSRPDDGVDEDDISSEDGVAEAVAALGQHGFREIEEESTDEAAEEYGI